MSHIVVIDGHVSEKSLTSHLVQVFIAGQEKKWHTVTRFNARDYELMKAHIAAWEAFPEEFSEARNAIVDADYLAIFTPMWNLWITNVLKNFVDGICQSWYVFKYGWIGGITWLLKNEKLLVVWLSGWPSQVMKLLWVELTAKHLRKVFKFYGVKKTQEINFRIHKPDEGEVAKMEKKMQAYKF